MSCVFEHGINRLKQIDSHMSPMFPLIEALYPDQAIQLHLAYSHRYPQDVASASSPCMRNL